MESYQTIQNRTHQTIAVIKQYDPGLRVGGIDVANLIAQSDALQALARQRDEAQAEYDIANNAEQQGYLAIRDLGLTLPKAAEVELNDNDPSQSVLLDLLSGVYALSPRNTELAVARGTKLLSALNRINAFLAAQNPPLPEVTSAGRGIAALAAALDGQPALERALEDRHADLNNARGVLRNGSAELDRSNKRFYAKLKAEARNNADLANALNQIDTLGAGIPSTLSIKTLLQGGADNLHILVNYDPGSYDGKADSSVEWQVEGVDADFAHSLVADPSGNALGPFVVGNTVNIRTRVKNSKGTTISSVRRLMIQ